MSFGTLTVARPGVSVAVAVVGPIGRTGNPGGKGDKGDDGLRGLQGEQGLTGNTGPTPFTPLAPWAPNTVYSLVPPASFVSNGGSSYVCLSGHTSSSSFAADLAAGLWAPVAQVGATGPANSLAIGTVTTLPPGSQAAASITGAAPNQSLNLSLPSGPQGASGNGSGNVIGPSSSTAGHVATYKDGTGTTLQDGADATLAANLTVTGTVYAGAVEATGVGAALVSADQNGGGSFGSFSCKASTSYLSDSTFGAVLSWTSTGIVVFAASPTAPTPATGDNSTKLATTAFVQSALPARGQIVALAGYGDGF